MIWLFIISGLQCPPFNVLCLPDLIHCTNELNVSIPHLADTLLERTASNSWIVVFKALITTHHLMMYGNEVSWQQRKGAEMVIFQTLMVTRKYFFTLIEQVRLRIDPEVKKILCIHKLKYKKKILSRVIYSRICRIKLVIFSWCSFARRNIFMAQRQLCKSTETSRPALIWLQFLMAIYSLSVVCYRLSALGALTWINTKGIYEF